MDKNTFDIAIEIEKIANKLSDIAELNNLGELNELVNKLEELHSRLLQLGKYSNDKIIEKEAIIVQPTDKLKSRTRIVVLYEYENGLALVEDTGMELHLIDKNSYEYI